MTIDSTIQSKQFQTNKKIVLANGTSSHILSSKSQFKPYRKEMFFSHTLINYNAERPKSRWRKISSLEGIDDQSQNVSKTSHKVLQISPNEKKLFNVSLNVHSPKQTPSKDSYPHDEYESYGSHSAPSTPYYHYSKQGIYNGSKELSNSYHETSFEPTLYTKYQVSYGATRGGHVVDAQLNHENNLPQYKWKGTRQLFYDYERKKSKRYGVEKEQIISTTLLQKWVPMDKNTITKNENGEIINQQLASQSANIDANDSCLNEKKEKYENTTLNDNVANLDNTKNNVVTKEDETTIISKDFNNEDLILSNYQQLPTSKSLHHLYSNLIEEDSKKLKEIRESTLNIHIDKNSANEQNMISHIGVSSLNSKELLSYDNGRNIEAPLHLRVEFANKLHQSTKTMSLQEEKIQMVQNCEPKIEMTDAIVQDLGVGVILDAIYFSIKSREASQKISFCIGAPLAEIEKFLFAVAPRFNPICHLVVPLHSIWQWYEKPSNYGLEVQGLDSFCNEPNSHTCLAYFLPYLSGIQIYGYKKLLSSMDGGSASWEILEPYIDTFKKKIHDNKNIYASSAQLLFEFFDSSPPSQRQPLFQK